MDRIEEAERRVALARQMKRVPLRWIVNAPVAAELGDRDELAGLPVEHAATRFGLELVCARPE